MNLSSYVLSAHGDISTDRSFDIPEAFQRATRPALLQTQKSTTSPSSSESRECSTPKVSAELSLLCPESAYLFYGILHHVSEHLHLALLAEAERSPNGLRFDGRVPLWLDDVDVVRFGKIEAVFRVNG